MRTGAFPLDLIDYVSKKGCREPKILLGVRGALLLFKWKSISQFALRILRYEYCKVVYIQCIGIFDCGQSPQKIAKSQRAAR